ncbi:GGDEF domain-containing protein [Couchioplanes caeruleus]|nr:GGDEF domain-containing protein [Couchioplanes caeruleus]
MRRRLATTRCQLDEARRQLGRAEHQARHDALTGLANRRGIEADLTARMVSGDSWALILLDLDEFKLINDRYGHDAGDQVLVETARRLCRVVHPGDLVGRLGGDEFAVLAASPVGAISMMLARDAVAVLSQPFLIDSGIRMEVTASVGLVQVMPGDDPMTLMRSADVAMYRAKASGGGTAVEFGPLERRAAGGEAYRPPQRLRDMHPHRVPSELGVVVAR